MNEFLKNSIKNHSKGIGKTFLCHMLAVALSWAAFPLIFLLVARYMTIDSPLAIFSVFATVIYTLMLLTTGDEMGLTDRKPYKWARYKAKGFVVGALAGIIVFLIQLLMIAIANRAFLVSHPIFKIANVNSYVRMILYMPFFWFYQLIKSGAAMIPSVTVFSSLFVVPFMSLVTGIGYLMGLAGIDIDWKKRKTK